jgi:hypothetical protein
MVAFSTGVIAAPRDVPRDPILTVDRVIGRAFAQSPKEGYWREVTPGMVLSTGDRISGCFEGRLPTGARISTSADNPSEVALVSAQPPVVALSAGILYCDTQTPMRVIGPGGERMECARGYFEASLVPLMVRPTQGAWALEEAAAIVQKKTNKRVEIDPRLREEAVRVDFDPEGSGEQVVIQLARALDPNDILLMPTRDGYTVSPQASRTASGERRLRVVVRQGEGVLTAAHGSVHLTAAEESRVNSREIALAPRRMKIPGPDDRAPRHRTMEMELDERAALVRVEGLNGVMQVKGATYWVRIPATNLTIDTNRPTGEMSLAFEYGPVVR